MAFRSASLRNNYLSNNENAHKLTKETVKVVSGPTLRRPVLGDRSNLLKPVNEGKKLKQNAEPFKKPVAAKPKPLKKASKKEEVTTTSVKVPAPDASMISLCTTTNTTTDISVTVLAEDMSVQVESNSSSSEKEVVDAEVEELSESFSNKLLTVTDIDVEDRENPQLVSIYVNEIYAYMRSLEDKNLVRKHYLEGAAVTPRMRTILVDWLVQVHTRFNLMQETLFLSIAILDRYLQLKSNTPKDRLQLVGVTAMFVASKYEEMYCAEINDFVFITDKAYTKRQIREMEIDILRTLNFYISYPLPIHFLRRNSKAGQVDGSQHALAKYLIELCLPDYAMSHFKASEIGAAALNLTLKLMGDKPHWTDTLVYYSGYTETDITPVVCKLAQCVTRSHNSKQQAIQQKYQNSKYMKISELSALKGNLIRQLSEKAASFS